MADVEKGLPVRSKEDADERLQSKLVDYTTPAQGMTVDTDGNAHAEMHGNDPAGTDKVLKVSELGNANTDGLYDAVNNTKPSTNAAILHQRNAAIDETHQTLRQTAVSGSDNTVCADVAIRDESGNPFSASNPMPVTFEQSEGTEEVLPNTAVDVASDGGTANHDEVVNNGETFLLQRISVAASGRAKWEFYEGDGAAVEVFTLKETKFTSEAKQEVDFVFGNYPIVGTADGKTIRVTKTNLDKNDTQNLYSTIKGVRS